MALLEKIHGSFLCWLGRDPAAPDGVYKVVCLLEI